MRTKLKNWNIFQAPASVYMHNKKAQVLQLSNEEQTLLYYFKAKYWEINIRIS